MRICPRFPPNSTASSEFIMNGQPVLLLAACRTVKSDRLLDSYSGNSTGSGCKRANHTRSLSDLGFGQAANAKPPYNCHEVESNNSSVAVFGDLRGNEFGTLHASCPFVTGGFCH